jgi:hypothetical protein
MTQKGYVYPIKAAMIAGILLTSIFLTPRAWAQG